MNLAENPFWLLGVSMEDEVEEIEERAEELAEESGETHDWEELAHRLRKPRDRIGCEIGWLPGVEPELARKLARWGGTGREGPWERMLKERGNPEPPRPSQEEFGAWMAEARRSPLGLANMRVTRTRRWKNTDAGTASKYLMGVATLWERVDAVAVAQQINRHRARAGIRAKATEEMVTEALEARRGWVQEEVKTALDRMATDTMVETMKRLSETATANGTRRAPEAVRDWIRMYEKECGEYFTAQMGAVKQLIRQADKSAKRGDFSRTRSLVGRLQEALGIWDRVAQAVQMMHQGEGSVDPITEEMFRESRTFSVRLHNEHGMTELSLEMVRTQRQVFAEAERLAEQTSKDEEVLSAMVESRT